MRTKQDWMDLVRGSTSMRTPDWQQIYCALACYEKDQAGKGAAVWHEMSLITKSKCCCAACDGSSEKARKYHSFNLVP